MIENPIPTSKKINKDIFKSLKPIFNQFSVENNENKVDLNSNLIRLRNVKEPSRKRILDECMSSAIVNELLLKTDNAGNLFELGVVKIGDHHYKRWYKSDTHLGVVA